MALVVSWVVSTFLLRAIVTWVALAWVDILLYQFSEAVLIQRFHLYINGDVNGVKVGFGLFDTIVLIIWRAWLSTHQSLGFLDIRWAGTERMVATSCYIFHDRLAGWAFALFRLVFEWVYDG